jgi:hypothetical protein
MKFAWIVVLGVCSFANPSFARGGVSGGGGTDNGSVKIVGETLNSILVNCGSGSQTLVIEKSRLILDSSQVIQEACRHPEYEKSVNLPETL